MVAFSMFMGSFVSEFGWSCTFVSSLYSAATVVSGRAVFQSSLVGLVSTIITGLLLDRTKIHHIVLEFACTLQMVAFVLLAYLRHPAVAYTHAAFDSLGGYTEGIIGLSALPSRPC